ncbi:MAG: lipoyl(octanoyl) transferase LipB [Gammaproteobacteria bacterium]|nr:lipoyl(octanoyl) transferase LipB [Gammaproteobacteria bacterium]
MTAPTVSVNYLGKRDYEPVWHAMQDFVTDRDPQQPGEIWVVEHPPVFTLGTNAKPEHVLAAGDIPLVATDRGGEVTYHGPGQLVVYPLVYLPATGLAVRTLVSALELAVVDTLAPYKIDAYPRRDAPGVYVDGKKIASIGLRIRKSWCYHGIAFNIAMDLEPFGRINPCGYAGLQITQTRDLGGPQTFAAATAEFIPHVLKRLGYHTQQI